MTAPTPAPVQQFVLLQLTSDPSGAVVRIGGEDRGTTPTQLELVGDAAKYNSSLEIVFVKDGYRSTILSRTVTSFRPSALRLTPRYPLRSVVIRLARPDG